MGSERLSGSQRGRKLAVTQRSDHIMNCRLLVIIVVLTVVAVNAQKAARIGPDGKPLLNRPDLEECEKRISHMTWGGHHYFLSWREPWHKFEDWDWFNGRNFCRDRCMDLVSFDTPGEYALFAAIMKKDNVSSIYTSGRKCNFKGKGCDAEHLQPININGWFWAGASNTRIPATNERQQETFWSPTGENRVPQPDNFEGLKEGPIETEFDIGVTIEGLQEFHDEACLAALNNHYRDGIAWHDVACHFRSVIVCEDSDQLISLVESQHGVDVKDKVAQSERQVELESIRLNEVQPIVRRPPPPVPPRGVPGRRPGQRPGQRRPPQGPGAGSSNGGSNGGIFGALRGRFPFLF